MISTTNASDPDSVLFDILRTIEGYGAGIYDDGISIATIGIGFNIEENTVIRNVVIASFGLDPNSTNNPENDDEYYVDQINGVLNGAAEPEQMADEVNAIMAAYAADTTRALTTPIGDRQHTFEFVNEEQAVQVFSEIIEPYRQLVRDFLANRAGGTNIPESSYEFVVLTSLAYNGPATLGGALARALSYEDHAEAWYEIRYNTNGNPEVENGIARRRFSESAVFAAYGDLGSVSAEERIDEKIRWSRTLNRHENKIELYEEEFATAFAAAEDDNITDGRSLRTLEEIKTQIILSLREDYALNIAQQAESAQLALEEAGFQISDSVTALLNLSGDIRDVFAAANFSNSGEAARYTVNAHDTNDLIFGGVLDDSANVKYKLHGGAGTDLIVVGSSNVLVDGGDGVDVLSFAEADEAITFEVSSVGISNVEVIVGSRHDGDRITGGDQDDVIFTGDFQGGDNDTINAGDGNDTIIALTGGGHTLNGDAGNDQIVSRTRAGSSEITINGGEGNDHLVSLSGEVIIDGGAGEDVILGGSGEDTLSGGDDDDLIYANNQANEDDDAQDILIGGKGADTFSSGKSIKMIRRSTSEMLELQVWSRERDRITPKLGYL